MKLHLTNIRQHKDRVFDIPDRGIVRLSGPSGEGKTTILDAVRHALYGDVSGMTHWDEKTSRIDLEWLNTKVVRSMKPNSLVAEKDGQTFVDDEAQAQLIRLLDMTPEEFMASSYIQQDFAESLLTLSPADQLRMIQRLAFGSDDPEVTKEKIKMAIDKRLMDLKVADRERSFIQTPLMAAEVEYKALEATTSASKPTLSSGFPEDQLLESKKKWTADYQAATKLVKQLQDLYNSNIYSLIDSLSLKKEAYKETKEDNEPLITQAKEKLAAFPEVNQLSPLRKQKETLEGTRKWFKLQAQALQMKSAYDEKYSERDKDVKLTDFIRTKIDQITKEEAKLQETLVRAEEEFRNLNRAANETLKCPQCDASLKYINNSLVRHTHDLGSSFARMSVLAEEITTIKKAQLKTSPAQELRIDLHTLNNIKAGLEQAIKPPYKTEAELDEAIANLDSQIVEAKTQDVQRQAHQNVISTAEAAIKKAKDAYEAAKASIAGQKPRPKKNVKDDLDEALLEQEVARKQIEVADDLLNKLKEEKLAIARWELGQEKLKKAESTLKTLREKEKEVEQRIVALQEEYAAALRLKEVSDQAAMESIANILQSINYNAKQYIDLMFPETGTQVIIKNKKELKSGIERAKPSLTIYHKGSVVNNFRELSGGERGRLTLAFHLALSDLYKSPILMIDESFKGLGAIDREIAIDCLRSISDNKLILVIEHNMQDSQADVVIDVAQNT